MCILSYKNEISSVRLPLKIFPESYQILGVPPTSISLKREKNKGGIYMSTARFLSQKLHYFRYAYSFPYHTTSQEIFLY